MTPMVYEVLDEFKAAEDKASVLRKYAGYYAFTTILEGAFHPNIHFSIKELPPYNKIDVPPGMGYTNMTDAIHRIYLFVEGSNRVDPNLTKERKRQLLIQILEALEPREAEVYGNVILKDLKVPGLTYELVKEVFPQMLP